MSKQNVTKGNPTARPANGAKGVSNSPTTNKPSGSTTSPKTNGTGAKTAPRTNGARAAVPAKRKSGFRLRPLDIALVLVGLLVVVFIAMSALQAPIVEVNPNASVPSDATHVPVGNAAPDFNLPDTTNTNYSLSSLKGKAVVLEYMATWCPHCQDDAPMMNQLADKYKGKDVQVLGINATPRGHDNTSPAKMDDLKWFKDTYSVSFPLLFDKDLKSAKDYGVLGYPSIYVVGKDGKVAFQPPTDSLPSLDTLSAAVDSALAK